MPRRMRTTLARAAFTIPCSEPITHLLAAGLAIRTVQNRHTRQLVDYIGLSLFAEFLEDAAQQTAGATMDITVTRAMRFLAEHLAERDCLQKTHHAVGVSRNTLIKRFHHDLKTTPARYLWRLRTERGIKLLAETGHTINEIAFQCGFQSPFHFSRLVRKLQGFSPREVRRRAWGN
jgi:AraC family L-rhamnose operon regulatory protein RhaS